MSFDACILGGMESIGSIPVSYNSAKPKTKADENFEKFADYHKENPEIYDLLCEFAFEQVNAGATKYSCRLILDRIKWDIDKRDYGDTDFCIPPFTSPWYARMFLANHSRHGDFFTIRKMPTAKKSPDGDKQTFISEEIPYVEDEYAEKLRGL